MHTHLGTALPSTLRPASSNHAHPHLQRSAGQQVHCHSAQSRQIERTHLANTLHDVGAHMEPVETKWVSVLEKPAAPRSPSRKPTPPTCVIRWLAPTVSVPVGAGPPQALCAIRPCPACRRGIAGAALACGTTSGGGIDTGSFSLPDSPSPCPKTAGFMNRCDSCGTQS